jgi:ABC-2 type transport system ATP-binding protein
MVRPAEPLLDVRDLSVRYGKREALRDFSLAARAGEVIGLLGPNGAGKSTALLAIAGAVHASAGRVRVGGVDAHAEPMIARRRIGLCDQPPTLHEFLTVGEHVEFVAEMRGKPGDATTKAVLASLGLDEVADRLCRELSFGYRQRVGLAAALAGGTEVVLLDETLNGLDPHAARAARTALEAAAARGATVLMSTHLLGVAERLCSRLVFMENGQLVHEVAGDAMRKLQDGGAAAIESLYLSVIRRGETA